MSSLMTRQQMAEKLRSGKETIVYQGRILRTVADIPSEAELAANGTTEEKKVAEKNLLDEMARINAELQALKGDSANEEKTSKVRKAAEDKTSVSAEK